VSRHSARQRRTGDARGQSLVEFTLVVPVLMMILFGMIEFGFVFTHDLTIEYATREGARAGAALANGGGTLGCGAGQSPNWTTVDPLVIAAVERVLQSPGSQVVIANVSKIIIYKANPTTGANDQGLQDVWTPGSGPIPLNATDHLSFDDALWHTNSDAWKACSRSNGLPNPDSIGVSVTYTYTFETPLASVMRFFGGSGTATLSITDKSVMQLNPSAT
jgi:Flp pilus assembly protein TadG